MKRPINFPAIAVCVVMHSMLGAVWYSVLFSSKWVALNGPASAAAASSGGLLPYAYSIFMSLMMALLMAWLCGRMRVRTALNGARLGLLVGFSTFLVGYATTYRFSGRPTMLALIDGMYPLISLMIMGAIIAVWRTKTQKLLDLQRA